MSNISIKLNLLQLKVAVRKMNSEKSGTIDCLVIPIDQNHLFRGNKGIYLDLQAFELKNKKEDSKDTHIVKQSLPKEVYDGLTEQDRKDMPILRNAIVWEAQLKEETTVSSAEPQDEFNDLPF